MTPFTRSVTGQTPDGVYVVLEGELALFDPHQPNEVLRVFCRDFVFDVEVVYNMPSKYTVKTFTP